jgi:peroxiredoxin
VAPGFELESIAGERVSLDSLTGSRTVMLAFVDPDCGPCGELMPDLVRWQSREDLSIIAVSRGGVAANRKKIAGHGLTTVLLQKDREVSKLYEVQGTPSAVLVGRDGRIASTVAGGAESIRALAARAPVIVERAVAASAAGEDNGHTPPKRLSVGDRVPAISLSGLDNLALDLSTLRDRDTVLLFWRPSCGFCARMAPEVKEWASHAANGRSRLVLVALDSQEANAAMDLRATIVLDPQMKAFNAFGATGTPIAVKLDRRGRVASPLARGTDEVRGLAQAAGLT